MSYFKKLWRGEIRLVITYWVFGFIVTTSFSFVGFIIEERILYIEAIGGLNEDTYFMEMLLYTIFYLILFAYVVFICIAIWRSSNRYEGPGYWAALAKFMVIISIIVNVFAFAGGA